MDNEMSKCDFCGEVKEVNRFYIHCKNKHFNDNKKGSYHKYISYCNDCGCKEEELKNDLIEALQWCSGSQDFQLEGKARKGWEKMCLPLLKIN